MEGTLKNKQLRRRKKRSDRRRSSGAEQEDSTDKNTNSKSIIHTSSHESKMDGHNSPETEIQNCSQFIEHEPSVTWGSPQGSPNGNEEQSERVIDLITPPQPQRIARKRPVTFKKQVRKLMPVDVSPSFFTKLLAFSEQCKDNEESAAAEKYQSERNQSCDEDSESRKHTGSLNHEPFQKPELAFSSTPVRDDYDMLLADDDDDVIIKCTQQMEKTINETESCSFNQLNSEAIFHNECRKSKKLHVNEINTSNTNNVRAPKAPVKFSDAKNNNIFTDKSPLPKSKAQTPLSKYYKSGVFIGYGSRKSPRTKKNIFETLHSGNQQESYNDSFESALKTFVDDDYSFLDTSVTKECFGKADLCDGDYDKKNQSVRVTSAKQTPNSKLKTRQTVVSGASAQKLKSTKCEQTITKSKAGNSKKLCDDCPGVLLGEKRKTIFESLTLEDDLVNETELVNVLDIVESQAVPSSPPLRCTPEEIQRKRIEAKQKLAKKKLTANKKTSVPSIIKPKR